MIFPDLNVWLALSLKAHSHSVAAWRWYRSLRQEEQIVFSRFTQLGLLRLLTTEAVARDETLTQMEAWAVYDGWTEAGGAMFLPEPHGIDLEFRFYANRTTPSPKEWADAYLIAFAGSISMPLVTFDKGLSLRYARTILLDG